MIRAGEFFALLERDADSKFSSDARFAFAGADSNLTTHAPALPSGMRARFRYSHLCLSSLLFVDSQCFISFCFNIAFICKVSFLLKA